MLPFAAGSGTDTTTRLISQHLSQALGVGIVIENKAGANGMIAATYVARAAPDGYTLLVTTNTTHSANPYLLKSLPTIRSRTSPRSRAPATCPSCW
ncbi:tripartite-type tricarboxylate transporter receptor subunit TctC [Bradyrhizobium sp. LB7.2]